MRKLKPIRVIVEENLHPEQIIIGVGIIRNFLKIAGAADLVSVELHDLADLKEYHVEREGHGSLLPYRVILGYLYLEDFGSKHEYINFLLVQNPILMDKFFPEERVIQGFSMENILGVAAVGKENNDVDFYIETVVIIHEFGHIYGLPSGNRSDSERIKELNGHCPNDCKMRSNASWDILEKIDLFNNPFCDQCLADLQEHFKK